MMPYGIDQWEKAMAEVEIRRWLSQIGQWAPEIELDRRLPPDEQIPLGELSPAAIDRVLREAVSGRIGCHADGLTYVVPIFYAYDGHYIYGHTGEGMKVAMMRANPEVCFEVDYVNSLTDWESVIAWGRFEELTGAAAEEATQYLINRFKPFMEDQMIMPSLEHVADAAKRKVVVYRIALSQRTGRYEKRQG
ncbi:MAG: pyridoxamine 5'-phosphate oxidase family protein [Chloroflexaceae bacterium]